MTTAELIRKLKAAGCKFVEHRTNHDLWVSTRTGKQFTVPRHPSNEVSKGTFYSILKDAGLK